MRLLTLLIVGAMALVYTPNLQAAEHDASGSCCEKRKCCVRKKCCKPRKCCVRKCCKPRKCCAKKCGCGIDLFSWMNRCCCEEKGDNGDNGDDHDGHDHDEM